MRPQQRAGASPSFLVLGRHLGSGSGRVNPLSFRCPDVSNYFKRNSKVPEIFLTKIDFSSLSEGIGRLPKVYSLAQLLGNGQQTSL